MPPLLHVAVRCGQLIVRSAIRTYNFPENRISDHRIGFKAYNLDQVLNGDLDAVINALQEADTQLRLSQVASSTP